MKSFKEFYILNEGGRFRDSKILKHEKDYPMFSVFTDKTDPNFEQSTQAIEDKALLLQNAFWGAKKDINKIGFPSMHANVVFKTVKDSRAGEAHGSSDHNTKKPKDREDRRKLRHIVISQKFLTNLEANYQQLVDTIVHEWSHLWMFDHGLEFRRAMDQYHEALINSNLDKIKPDTSALDFPSFFLALSKHIATYKNGGSERKLSQGVRNALDDTLQALGAFYKHIPEEFIDYVSEVVTENIVASSEQSLTQISRVLKGMGIESHIKNYLENDLEIDPERVGDSIRGQIAKKVNYPSAYGLQDSDEAFAVAIEKFDKLDPYHKKRILELMQVR